MCSFSETKEVVVPLSRITNVVKNKNLISLLLWHNFYWKESHLLLLHTMHNSHDSYCWGDPAVIKILSSFFSQISIVMKTFFRLKNIVEGLKLLFLIRILLYHQLQTASPCFFLKSLKKLVEISFLVDLSRTRFRCTITLILMKIKFRQFFSLLPGPKNVPHFSIIFLKQ